MDLDGHLVARRRRAARGGRPHRDRAPSGVLTAERDAQCARLAGHRDTRLRSPVAVTGLVDRLQLHGLQARIRDVVHQAESLLEAEERAVCPVRFKVRTDDELEDLIIAEGWSDTQTAGAFVVNGCLEIPRAGW